MKAKVNLRVEIVEGQDTGYILEETNRLVDLQRTSWGGYGYPEKISPYRLTIEFVTPECFRRDNKESNG
jgi:hypothetical protein